MDDLTLYAPLRGRAKKLPAGDVEVYTSPDYARLITRAKRFAVVRLPFHPGAPHRTPYVMASLIMAGRVSVPSSALRVEGFTRTEEKEK